MVPQSLVIKEASGARRVVPLDHAVLRLGRAADNDIVLEDPDLRISRWHATIECSPEGTLTIRDEGSINGTFVNGRRIAGKVPLHHRDQIEIGGHQLELRAEDHVTSPWQIETGPDELNLIQSNSRLVASGTGKADPSLQTLELLHEVGITLARTGEVSHVMEQTVQLLFKIKGVQRATVWLWGEKEGSFQETPLVTRPGFASLPKGMFDPQHLALSTTILNHVRKQNRPISVRDAKASPFSAAASIVRSGIQAALCSPLTSQGRFLGIVYADNLEQADAFSAEDFRTFTFVAAQSGLALASAQARDEISRQQTEHAMLRCYLPPQVMDMVLAKGGSLQLGGVLQPVTVLFADIRGFTKLSEQMDARQVVDLLNEFFSIMTKEIFDTQGTLDKFIGDAIMALFGAPIPSEKSPRQALIAAVRMQQQMSRLNIERVQRGEIPIHIGIGLHHGLAVVGNIGSAQRMQYTAIGDTVNVAARLVGRAEPDQILISKAMYEAAGASAFFSDLGLFSVKGREEQLHAYSVAWERIPSNTKPPPGAAGV